MTNYLTKIRRNLSRKKVAKRMLTTIENHSHPYGSSVKDGDGNVVGFHCKGCSFNGKKVYHPMNKDGIPNTQEQIKVYAKTTKNLLSFFKQQK